MDIKKAIYSRRSVRYFNKTQVKEEDIQALLRAAICAPSGLNNQPWKFLVVDQENQKNKLAGFTKYAYVIKGAPSSICVFLDKTVMYNREKDIMAIGACIQNMLLQAYALGIGSCWLGEILNKKEEVREFLNVSPDFELMAVISFGYRRGKSGKTSRKKMKSFLLK